MAQQKTKLYHPNYLIPCHHPYYHNHHQPGGKFKPPTRAILKTRNKNPGPLDVAYKAARGGGQPAILNLGRGRCTLLARARAREPQIWVMQFIALGSFRRRRAAAPRARANAALGLSRRARARCFIDFSSVPAPRALHSFSLPCTYTIKCLQSGPFVWWPPGALAKLSLRSSGLFVFEGAGWGLDVVDCILGDYDGSAVGKEFVEEFLGVVASFIELVRDLNVSRLILVLS